MSFNKEGGWYGQRQRHSEAARTGWATSRQYPGLAFYQVKGKVTSVTMPHMPQARKSYREFMQEVNRRRLASKAALDFEKSQGIQKPRHARWAYYEV